MKNPVCRADPLFSIDVGEVASADDEPHRQALREKLKAIDFRSRKQVEDKLVIGEFVDFVRVENPRLLPVLEAIAVTRTQGEAGQTLGIAATDVGRLFRQVRALGRSFLSGKAGTQPRRETQSRTETNALQMETARVSSQPSGSFSVYDYWNRVELYKEVWNQPLVKLSLKYRMSDVRLGKVCRKLKIPHPGRGYWAKRAVGIAVEQLPLPEFKDAPLVRRLKTKSRRRKPQIRIGSERRAGYRCTASTTSRRPIPFDRSPLLLDIETNGR